MFAFPLFILLTFQPNLSVVFLFFILLIAFLITVSVIPSFLSPCFLIVCRNPFLLYTLSAFPQLFLTVLFSVGFHKISCIPLKSRMNIQLCCFFIFDIMGCFISNLDLPFNFLYFPSVLLLWRHSYFYFFDVLFYKFYSSNWPF